MSGIQMSFNATTVAPNVTPEPVPSGIYDVVIKNSEEKAVSGKPGQFYYQFDMEITEGEYKGRKIVDRLNCKHPNQQTMDIAYGTLSAICHVTRVMQIGQSSAELHNRPFKVNVVKVPRTDDPTKESNEVRGYLDSAGNPPGKQAAAGGAASSAFGGTTPTTTVAPSVPSTPSIPSSPSAPADPLELAKADGWQVHPDNPAFMYKGSEVKGVDAVKALFAAPNLPAGGASTPAPAVPETPATGAASAAIPSWAQ